ncbi:HD-GYP domain-containing protein [Thermospira aquatica]|uniref:HD-GYP domain-containing protein n=1 Tax=Thermospira aquatica TaxID=2828656 RepID=A0AAX3BES9_9SPIR|nr:HD-GYP domain-containing protein [Thermospira aquatica]URA10817.1 HD-GYP domain-containing protein [Thermospira aquatica]
MAKERVELFTKFLHPGMILKGDLYSFKGQKLLDARTPLTQEFIRSLLAKGIEKVYYDRVLPEIGDKESDAEVFVQKEKMIDDALIKEAINVSKEIEEAIKKKSILPKESVNKVVNGFVESIQTSQTALLNLIETKNFDEQTYSHMINVSLLAILFGKKLNYNEVGLNVLGLAGLLHDVGKTLISPEIFHKTEPLTPEEIDILRKHPIYGYELLRRYSDYGGIIQKIVLLHHEKVSGKGYPFGLRGEQMGEASQIVSICDLFDSITSDHPYRPAKPFWAALVEVYQQSGISFAPRLAKSFITDIPSYLVTEPIFPVGSFVVLSTGEVGEVIDFDNPHSLFPTVMIYISGSREIMRYPIQVNLAIDDTRSIKSLITHEAAIQKLQEIKQKFFENRRSEAPTFSLYAMKEGTKDTSEEKILKTPPLPEKEDVSLQSSSSVDLSVIKEDESGLK